MDCRAVGILNQPAGTQLLWIKFFITILDYAEGAYIGVVWKISLIF